MRHLGLWGRYWKITSEHQVLCMGDLPVSLHLLEEMSAWVQSMKSQGTDPHRSEANAWKVEMRLAWASPLKLQVPWGLQPQSTTDLVVGTSAD